MRNGLYSIRFFGDQGEGTGVIIVDDESVRGGDSGYYYFGKLKTNGDGKVSAEIEVKQFEPRIHSVFGEIESFTLLLNGRYEDPQFKFEGQIKNRPEKISISGRLLQS